MRKEFSVLGVEGALWLAISSNKCGPKRCLFAVRLSFGSYLGRGALPRQVASQCSFSSGHDGGWSKGFSWTAVHL